LLLQGGWETDETAAEAAARESLEEAGVRGELQVRTRARHPLSNTVSLVLACQELGNFSFTSKSCRCEAHVFVMSVTEELSVWPERAERRRDWLSVDEALQRCRHAWMREAIRTWHASAVRSVPAG